MTHSTVPAADTDMTMQEYQRSMQRTWKDRPKQDAITNAIFGLVGEIAEAHKKAWFHDKPLDREELLSELGDVLFYLTALAHEHDFTLAQVAQYNQQKLQRRHPAGWSTEYHDKTDNQDKIQE
jgi:NTP pyrophosphatase (non-canonical NTP hydrolase)